jgi:hypothetical protein
MPIPGIVASQITGHLSTNSYESIQTVTVGSGGASSVVFSSIPSIYKHLQIRAIGRCDAAVTVRNTGIQINSDTAANYSIHELFGDGSTALVGAAASQTAAEGFILPGTTIGANIFGTTIIDILDYTNTNKNKTLRALSGMDSNGYGRVYMYSGAWFSTTTITSINLFSGANFTQYSSFALYGVKG